MLTAKSVNHVNPLFVLRSFVTYRVPTFFYSPIRVKRPVAIRSKSHVCAVVHNLPVFLLTNIRSMENESNKLAQPDGAKCDYIFNFSTDIKS